MASIRVKCLYPFNEHLQAQLRAISPYLAITFTPPDGESQVNAVDDPAAEVLLSNYCPADLSRLPNLKWLALAGAGIEHLRDADPWSHGVTVTNGSGLSATAIAEYVISSFLRFSQRVADKNANQQERAWPRPWTDGWVDLLGYSLRGRTVTVVGYGSIGREVARLASAFGMRVLAVKARPSIVTDSGYTPPGVGDPSGSIPERIVGSDQIAASFAESDFVALTLPWTPATDRIVDQEAIRALPGHAVLVNVGRGGILDEAALADALQLGAIRGAVLDVVSVEPLSVESSLWSVPNLVLTPHVSGINDPTGQWVALAALMTENLRRYANGQELVNVVSPAAGY